MKKLATFIPLVIGILSCFILTGQNIVPNPSFEDGLGNNFDNWTVFNPNPDDGSFTETNSEVYDGNRAVQVVTEDGDYFSHQLVSDPIPTAVGGSYTFTIWVKGVTAGGVIRVSTNPGLGNEAYGADFTVSEDWTQLSFTFTAQSETTTIALDLGQDANTYYLDDMFMEGPPAVGSVCTPVENGGFEDYNDTDGTFTGWSFYNQGNGSSFGLAVNPDNVYSGNNALRADNVAGTERFLLQLASPAFPTVTGQDYTFTIWIRAETPNTNDIQFSAREGEDPFNTETQFMTTANTIGGDWMELSYVFTANSASSIVTLNLGGETDNTFYT
ncbi:MAG: carbohydrate binding domain-containing protein, partial [Bacteroidota bacterium]